MESSLWAVVPRRSQGGKANSTGQRAESTVASMLHGAGYAFQRQYRIGMSIYGEPLKCDFYVTPCDALPLGLIIEVKWQGSAGSVDEKFPYLVENIRSRFPAPALIVLAGGGYKPGAEKWLRAQVDGESLVAVCNLDQFQMWCNRHL